MNFLIRISFLIVLFLVIQSCEYFNTTTINPKQIKEQSNWNDKDQPPSFPKCDGLDSQDQMDCFKNIVSQTISDILYQYNFTASSQLDEEVILNLEVDTEGYFSLLEVEDETDVLSQIETLYSSIEEAVSGLPQALPAIKTNVGIKVKTSFKLPVRIIASPQS
tara:strand:+ start:24515 stop:25003 length:489 start_codon:yes stop_codon:yes gene_type:complete